MNNIYINFNGTVCPLEFNANVLEQIENNTELRFLGGKVIPKSIQDLKHIMYACIKQTLPEVTLAEVGDFLMAEHLPEVMELIGAMMAPFDTDPRMLAPFVPTPKTIVTQVIAMAVELADQESDRHFLDIGCGQGDILVAAQRAGFSVTGFELNQERAMICQTNLNQNGFRGEVLREDVLDPEKTIFAEQIKRADVIYAYLLVRANSRISPYLLENMKPGAVLITQDFPMKGMEAKETIEAPNPDELTENIVFDASGQMVIDPVTKVPQLEMVPVVHQLFVYVKEGK